MSKELFCLYYEGSESEAYQYLLVGREALKSDFIRWKWDAEQKAVGLRHKSGAVLNAYITSHMRGSRIDVHVDTDSAEKHVSTADVLASFSGCYKQLHGGYIDPTLMRSLSGEQVPYVPKISGKNAESLLRELSGKIKVNAIIWLVIGALQISLGLLLITVGISSPEFVLGVFMPLVGALNVGIAIWRISYSEKILQNPVGIVQRYEPINYLNMAIGLQHIDWRNHRGRLYGVRFHLASVRYGAFCSVATHRGRF